MSVLVTGGAGYIGAHVVAALAASGRQVVVLDDLSSGQRTSLPPDVELVVTDVRDEATLASVYERQGISSAIHLAALKSVEESMRQAPTYFSVNVEGTRALLATHLAAGAGAFVFSSSAAVYGAPTKIPVTEDAPVAPSSVYGESKAIGERMVEWIGTMGELPYAILRYFNVAGAAEDGSLADHRPEPQNLIPRLLRALSTGSVLEVFGDDYPTVDGTAVRDYVDVRDVAVAHVAVLDSLETDRTSMTLNLGRGVGTSVAEVIRTAESVTGRRCDTRLVQRRTGDVAEIWADVGRAERLIGWTARHGLADMIGTAWRGIERTASERSRDGVPRSTP